MKLEMLYMFLDSSADSSKNKAIVETQNTKLYIVGVSSAEEGAETARRFIEEGITLIELCGGFGYDGARKVNESVGEKVPVGMIVHQVWNAAMLAELLGEE